MIFLKFPDIAQLFNGLSQVCFTAGLKFDTDIDMGFFLRAPYYLSRNLNTGINGRKAE
jgi:hypothetical protein